MTPRSLVGVPAGSALVDVDGTRIAVAREGRGAPVVCLHATGHGGRDYETFAALMKDRFEIIRVDWPGQGRSESDSHPPTAARYAALLHGVLDQMEIERPILIGNSIGGAAALHYASQHPVRALVLCNSAGLMPVTAQSRRVCAAFVRFFAAGENGAWWFKAAFRAYYRFLILPAAAAAQQRRRIVASAAEIAPILKQAWFGFGQPDADIRGLAARINSPVWFAWAKRDRLLALKRNLPAILQMENATISTFDGGHSAFLEEPQTFAKEFLAFCERHELTAPEDHR